MRNNKKNRLGDYQILDQFSRQSIGSVKKKMSQWLGFYTQFYYGLESQRSRHTEELKKAICLKSKSYPFDEYWRVVRFKYSLFPLSSRGSLEDIGGRFNIGKNIQYGKEQFPSFPALYVASDADTALCEVFGDECEKDKLDRFELALAKPSSYSLVRIKGELSQVFDLTDRSNLDDFFNIIKNVKLTKDISARAKEMCIQVPAMIKNVSDLERTILDRQWRIHPMRCDIPSNSQVFGQIAEASGINGILYPSAKGPGENLAVFTRNFANDPSWIELVDETPDHKKIMRRLDQNTIAKL